MSREHINHAEIVKFAQEQVNLPADKAKVYRAQVRGLREKLEAYLAEHPDFSLKKILLSGSLSKGTALKTLNDIDVACYISGADIPTEIDELLRYLAERLRSAYPNFKPDQIQPQTYSVTVSFRGTGLDVDVVPILYDGDPDWYGNLVSQDDGSFLKTCVPRHKEFITKRKKKHDTDFAQVVRLAKFWVRRLKAERPEFRFKSFMVELILAHLSDDGSAFSDYPDALQAFFNYLATSDLREKIVFTDFYRRADVPDCSDPIQMLDPVNEENNVCRLYTEAQADAIVDAALDAGDAIAAALRAPTKGDSLYYWRKVFGPSFDA